MKPLANLYRDLHAHPELSNQEHRTAMIDDHPVERFPKPDVILGQHVMPPAAGEISYRSGVTQSEEDNIEVRLFGRSGHGAWPEATIDPVVMAAATVLRLQTMVSREIAALEPAVVTIGSLQSSTKGNVIPDDAVLKINVRSFDHGVRARVLAAIKRIVTAEANASGAPQPPSFKFFEHFGLTVNNPGTAEHVGAAFRAYFGTDRVTELTDPLPVSEDFGVFGHE